MKNLSRHLVLTITMLLVFSYAVISHAAEVKEIRMATDAKDVHREAHTKIRARIVAALEKEFGLEQTFGLQIDFGDHVDTLLSLPPDFSKGKLSNERIVAALQKEFGIKFQQGAFIRFGDHQQGADIWLPIPHDFLKGELSNDEVQTVAGRSIMIRCDILPGKFLQETKPGEFMIIRFGIYPAKFFEQSHMMTSALEYSESQNLPFKTNMLALPICKPNHIFSYRPIILV